MQRALTIAVSVSFALGLAAALYLHAATASVFDSYQPGIDKFLANFNPLLIILIVVGTPLVGTFVPHIRPAASQIAQTLARVALATTTAVMMALVVIDWLRPCKAPRPVERELQSTLQYSLLCPQLSNRSYFGPLYANALSGLLIWVANRRHSDAGSRYA